MYLKNCHQTGFQKCKMNSLLNRLMEKNLTLILHPKITHFPHNEKIPQSFFKNPDLWHNLIFILVSCFNVGLSSQTIWYSTGSQKNQYIGNLFHILTSFCLCPRLLFPLSLSPLNFCQSKQLGLFLLILRLLWIPFQLGNSYDVHKTISKH